MMRGSFQKNRLGLAQWLIDPQNPLTARVAVNLWVFAKFLSGRGLTLLTSEDFGKSGDMPFSSGNLLDWLALELSRLRCWM